MSYWTVREQEIRAAYGRVIEDLIRTWRPDRPTVLLLPGGMGSQLDRSPRPYRTDADFPSSRPYDPVWMDPGLLFDGDALTLEILPDGRDRGGHIIVPNGPLRFITTPYLGTAEFFADPQHAANYAVFGFDWRRPVEEAAWWLGEFVRIWRKRSVELNRPDPWPDTTLLAHSMGGLVAKLFLNTLNGAREEEWPARFISVGTPFYGTWSHAPRYYIGQPPLNTLHGATRMAKIVGSLPGPYILMFADQATLDRDGAVLGLSQYPLRDGATRGPVDPYDPAQASRWPAWVSQAHLQACRKTFDSITAPLTDPLAERVFHLRTGLDRSTPTQLLWDDVRGSRYRPGRDPSPFQGVLGPEGQTGDGTVPYWSARLAGTPDTNVYDLTQADSHPDLLESVEVLDVVWTTLQRGHLPERTTGSARYLGDPAAPESEAIDLVEAVKAGELQRGDPETLDPQRWRQLMNQVALA